VLTAVSAVMPAPRVVNAPVKNAPAAAAARNQRLAVARRQERHVVRDLRSSCSGDIRGV
jgi:hypothetical protein